MNSKTVLMLVGDEHAAGLASLRQLFDTPEWRERVLIVDEVPTPRPTRLLGFGYDAGPDVQELIAMFREQDRQSKRHFAGLFYEDERHAQIKAMRKGKNQIARKCRSAIW